MRLYNQIHIQELTQCARREVRSFTGDVPDKFTVNGLMQCESHNVTVSAWNPSGESEAVEKDTQLRAGREFLPPII